MPLPVVTPTDLTTRYAAFATVDPTTIQAFLDEATGGVDDSWILADQKPALMAYAAHLMALDGVGAAASTVDLGGQALEVTGALESVQVGDVRVKFGSSDGSDGGGSGSYGQFARTGYGRRYYELLLRSNPAVLVA